jgi:hypothetical protein
MNDDQANDSIRRWDKMEGERSVWKSHWQEVSNYMAPERADFTWQSTPGAKRMTMVFDSTPIWALEQFAAGMHSLLTSPTLQWFSMLPEDDGVGQDDGVHAWLDDASRVMYAVFNSPSRNFAAQSYELYRDIGLLGTGVMAEMETPKGDILFSTRHLRECNIAENDEDRIDTLVRRWQYTARQAYAAWGAAAGEKVAKAAQESPDQKFTFLHDVRPRQVRDIGRADAKHKPFLSRYVCLDDKHTIMEGGFDEFPYLVPRLDRDVIGPWGRGRGMAALPDVKMLNKMVQLVIKAAQKVIDPPLQVPDDGFLTGIKTTPGGVNFYRAGSNDRIEPIRTNGDINLGIEMLNSTRQSIIRAFYVEWMLMPSDMSDPAAAGKGVTATYTLQQRDEKMRLLSPLLARLQSEFLGPLIDRTFNILWRRSKAMRFGLGSPFKQPPQGLSGARLRVEYVSPIAIAQKTSQLDGVMRLIQLDQTMRQSNPNAPQVLDFEAILRLAGRDLNTPALALKSTDQVAQEAQQAAEAQAQMNNHAALANVAGAARDGAGAVKSMAQAQQVMQPADDQAQQVAA